MRRWFKCFISFKCLGMSLDVTRVPIVLFEKCKLRKEISSIFFGIQLLFLEFTWRVLYGILHDAEIWGLLDGDLVLNSFQLLLPYSLPLCWHLYVHMWLGLTYKWEHVIFVFCYSITLPRMASCIHRRKDMGFQWALYIAVYVHHIFIQSAWWASGVDSMSLLLWSAIYLR